ncbi:MAG TPA: ABC transporter permease [Devosia sp.]|jgi:peptide/nickel transport system permease protein|uniref:ABC transporter permease n=1 Tax=Devosia sp. TaxID=1871048 RepID=UPI002DDC91DE|nr:ABC transporter permease [Devosia sp.]HEV2517178.1 ABC transporter permease [Devosia sp.]
MSYLRLVGQRLVMMVLTLWGLATLVFIMIKLIPGDEAQVAAGAGATAEQVAQVTKRLGLDQPIPLQYLNFLGRLLRGDLGTSVVSSKPVLTELAAVLPSTLELMVFASILGVLLAFPAALVAATFRGKVVDGVSRLVAVMGGAMPTFWLALMLQYFLGSVLRITPITGQHSFGVSAPSITGMPTVDALLAGNLSAFFDALAYLILPAFVFAVPFASQVYRILRATLLGVLASDLVLPVLAKGASTRRIVLRHALPNSLAPTVSLIGTLVGGMVGGAILIETVFARRGVGGYLANSVALKDTYAVLGAVMFVGVTVCVVNLVADIATLMLDPRVRGTQFRSGAK